MELVEASNRAGRGLLFLLWPVLELVEASNRAGRGLLFLL
jgi:hypothetical protein